MYTLTISRVRLDLGNDLFFDVSEALAQNLLESKTPASLASDLKSFIAERDGQVVELSDEEVVFDTRDTTITVLLGHYSGQISSADAKQFFAAMNK